MNQSYKLTLIIKIIVPFIIFTILTSVSIAPAQAQFEEGMDLYAGVLLYSSDFSYNLEMLDEMADAGEVLIIDEYSDLIDLGLVETDVINGGTFYQETDMDSDIQFIPGTYYIYSSHYNPEVGVVIYEVENSVVYPEPDFLGTLNQTENPYGFEESSEGAWRNISGLSVNLVIPAVIKEKQLPVVIKTLHLDFELDLNETLSSYMDQLGYVDSGFSTYQTTTENESKVVSVIYEKGQAEIWLSTGMGGQTWDSITSPGESVVQLVFYGDIIDDSYDRDMEKVLNFFNVRAEKWDEAKQEKMFITDLVLSPTIEIVDEEFSWISAMQSELNWLAQQGIISGLSEQKIKEIAESTIAGMDVFAVQETPAEGLLLVELGMDDGSFSPTESGPMFSEIVNSALVKLGGTPDKPTKPDQIPIFVLQVVGGIIVVALIGIFGYTRLKRRNILDNLNRKNIFNYIKSHQGIHFKKLLRELDFQPGAMSYHLNVLEKGEYIKSIQDGNMRRFYLYGTKSEFKIALTSIQLRILSIVNERPGISQSNISKLLGKNRMLVNYHIKILDDANLISMEKEGRRSMVYTTGNAETYLS